jgi:ribosomal-protein-alanine N-acetyltransferase
MVEADLDQVLAIEEASFGSPWRREHFLFELLENRWAVNQVVKLGAEVVGYACVWHFDDELKINNIAVAPRLRGQGLGRFILRRVLADARRDRCVVARLEVRRSNQAARHLYESQGFREVGQRSNYYAREGEDAILMDCDLT